MSVILPMFLFAMLTASTQAEDAPKPVTIIESKVKLGSIDIPNEIGPAIAPYMTCRILASGTELRVEGKALNAEKPSAADCDTKKEKAVKYAHELLKKQGVSNKNERTSLIDKTMAEVDVFAAQLGDIAPREDLAGSEKLEEEGNAPNN